ncbi:MAG TPA: hypothetical protein VEV82_03005, partial [Actinomycetota bacterium]|nr:hypothetical protein [Actinomycetota bacterium]
FGHPHNPGGPNGTYGCGQYLCGGVNLRDERVIENNGTTVLSEAGFIAADDGTTFKNTNGGRFVLENDRGYYQGFLQPGPARSSFINNGAIVKNRTLGKDGPSRTSVFDADYTQNDPGAADKIKIKAGAVTVPNGTGTRSAEVVPTAALGTGSCSTGTSYCPFPETTAADKQTSWVQLPAKANKAKVKIVERERGNALTGVRTTTPSGGSGGTQTRPIGEVVDVKLSGDSRKRGAPIKVAFAIHKSDLNGENDPKQIELRVGGKRVRKCRGAAGKVNPLPACLSFRDITNQGDYKARVLTTPNYFFASKRTFTARRYK